MPVTRLYYIGAPGNYTIADALLAYTTILQVTRSGMTYSVTTAPGTLKDLEVYYDVSRGKIQWSADKPFAGPAPGMPFTINDLERISVKFKY